MIGQLSLAVDCVSAVFMAVLLYTLCLEYRITTLRSKLFTASTVAILVALLVDIACWMTDGTDISPVLQHTLNLVSVTIGEIIATLYVYFEIAFINERSKTSWYLAHGIACMNLLGIIHTGIMDIQGKLFIIQDNCYLPGEAYEMIGITVMISLVFVTAFAVFKHKILGTHDTLSLVFYVVPPLISTYIETNCLPITLTFTASAVSLLFIYMTIQARALNSSRIRSDYFEEMTVTDPLTGLGNRRAYELSLAAVAGSDGEAGTVFCDLNSLKETNDTLGHEAGDDLINHFASLFRSHFGKENVYRIGGDEFVALLPGIDSETFTRQAETFLSACTDHGEIASVGYRFGNGRDIRSIVPLAENDMYMRKREHYLKNTVPAGQSNGSDSI